MAGTVGCEDRGAAKGRTEIGLRKCGRPDGNHPQTEQRESGVQSPQRFFGRHRLPAMAGCSIAFMVSSQQRRSRVSVNGTRACHTRARNRAMSAQVMLSCILTKTGDVDRDCLTRPSPDVIQGVKKAPPPVRSPHPPKKKKPFHFCSRIYSPSCSMTHTRRRIQS
jgi:hypothetical protein